MCSTDFYHNPLPLSNCALVPSIVSLQPCIPSGADVDKAAAVGDRLVIVVNPSGDVLEEKNDNF